MTDLVTDGLPVTKSTRLIAEKHELRETSAKITPVQNAAGRRFKGRIIEGDRWGSSGYYSREVLERDGPTTWPAGTQVYLDHPTVMEDMDRPERSVRDLAGRINTTPAYEGDGLYAEIEFYPHVAPVIEAMWEDVGMSIRASAAVENGEADGRRGPIIQALMDGESVDVVTKAGAGGKLVSLLESARNAQNPPPVPAGSIKEREEAIMADTTITEALNRAEEANSRAAALEAEKTALVTERDALKTEVAALKEAADQAAREGRKDKALAAVAEVFGKDAPKFYVTAAESAAKDDDYDHDAFAATVNEAAAARESANGAGQPSGVGETAGITEAVKTDRTDDILNLRV